MCEYCTGDKGGYVKELPKQNKGFNAYVWDYGLNSPYLEVTGERNKGIFSINFCPMCGKELKQMGE